MRAVLRILGLSLKACSGEGREQPFSTPWVIKVASAVELRSKTRYHCVTHSPNHYLADKIFALLKVLWGLIPKTSKTISRYSHYLIPSIPDLFIKIQVCNNNLTVAVDFVRDNSCRMCVKVELDGH